MSDQPEPLHPSYNRVKDNTYVMPCKVVVKLSDPRVGLGVFAIDNIEKGEVIERCPALQLIWRSHYIGDPLINKYVWQDPCTCDVCKEHGHHLYLLLGCGSLYNHRDEPNAECDISFPKLVADIRALKDIEAGEEICIHYGSHYFGKRRKLNI